MRNFNIYHRPHFQGSRIEAYKTVEEWRKRSKQDLREVMIIIHDHAEIEIGMRNTDNMPFAIIKCDSART